MKNKIITLVFVFIIFEIMFIFISFLSVLFFYINFGEILEFSELFRGFIIFNQILLSIVIGSIGFYYMALLLVKFTNLIDGYND